MAKPAKRPATYEDLLQVPEHLVAELVDGELYATPRPSSPHLLAASALGATLVTHFHRGGSGPAGWWILDEPELRLGSDVLVPDLAGWRRERMPLLPNTPAFDLPPDWICEIVSPTTAGFDRVRKLPTYARHGVQFAWLIDPLQQTLEVFQTDGMHWVGIASYQGENAIRAIPFEAIELPLSALWLPSA